LVQSTIHHTGMLSGDVTRLADCLPDICRDMHFKRASAELVLNPRTV